MSSSREYLLHSAIIAAKGQLAERVDSYDLALADMIKRAIALAEQEKRLKGSRRVSHEDLMREFTI